MRHTGSCISRESPAVDFYLVGPYWPDSALRDLTGSIAGSPATGSTGPRRLWLLTCRNLATISCPAFATPIPSRNLCHHGVAKRAGGYGPEWTRCSWPVQRNATAEKKTEGAGLMAPRGQLGLLRERKGVGAGSQAHARRCLANRDGNGGLARGTGNPSFVYEFYG